MRHKRTATARSWQYKHRFFRILRKHKIKNKFIYSDKNKAISRLIMPSRKYYVFKRRFYLKDLTIAWKQEGNITYLNMGFGE